jgi:hypothetical protein
MSKTPKLLSNEEMTDLFRRMPVWVEQLRAKVVKAMADGDAVIAAHCRKVLPTSTFRARVRAFGRNEVPYMDLWEMLALYSVLADIEAPRLPRIERGTERNGRKPGSGWPTPRKLVVHPGLVDD